MALKIVGRGPELSSVRYSVGLCEWVAGVLLEWCDWCLKFCYLYGTFNDTVIYE